MTSTQPRPIISLTPPGQPGLSSHPRRVPSHRSVSLLHSPRSRTAQASDSSSDSNRAQNPRKRGHPEQEDSPSSLQPMGRDSSDESSNAEKWFEKSNNDILSHKHSFMNDDPPFFMRNSSSSESPPDAQQQQQLQNYYRDNTNSLPLRTGLMNLGSNGSSNEDFRGVIDDLTIENKKLKRRLKKYEKLHDSHLKDEKLFEVRIHGLPSEKKGELEETLRKFASSLSAKAGTEFPVSGYEGLPAGLRTHMTGSSQTSLHNADSAYASMSASNQGSSGQSGSGRSKPFEQSVRSRSHHIQSFLHHIPEGLLPSPNPSTLTERARKKLVVRRLEQIFAGKGATTGGHQQALQQQDVSHMAARADATGPGLGREGLREASIMPKDKSKGENNQTEFEGSPDAINETEHLKVAEHDFASRSSDTSEQQRPTRPLDLDPHRAQVPQDNVRYIRHLGFSPPDLESSKSPEEGHGWMYLNLLINMAQLHTISVTSDFVRKAIAEYSEKFEVSRDGRKVRWKGGRHLSRSSSQGGSSSMLDRTDDDGQSSRKRQKLSTRSAMRSSNQARAVSARADVTNNKLAYTPLFFHRDGDDDNSSSEEEDDETLSPFPLPVPGDSSGMTSSGMRTITTKKKQQKRDDGPIIFYNNARFCTDLSGDRQPVGNKAAPPYRPVSSLPVGKAVPTPAECLFEKRGPLAEAVDLPEPMDLGDNPIPESMEITFPPQSPTKSEDSDSGKSPIVLEVSGMGGVYPADNFAIEVQSRHARVDQDEAPTVPLQTASKNIPSRFVNILRTEDAKRPVRAAVSKAVNTTLTRKELAPSSLPPALSFMPFSDGSFSDDGSDAEDDMSLSPESPGAMPPSAAPQAMEIHYSNSEDEDEDDEDDDDSDDDSDTSLDLLAAAREVDPEAIRAREREYDANMAERLAEEIPAGSSAATAGGGSGFNSPASGFNSPASGVDRKEYRKAMEKKQSIMKQAKAGDSMASMAVQNDSSDNESDDGSDGESNIRS